MRSKQPELAVLINAERQQLAVARRVCDREHILDGFVIEAENVTRC